MVTGDLIPEEACCVACNGVLEAKVASKTLPALNKAPKTVIDMTLWCEICLKCDLTYPYRQTSDGVFVYQKTAISLELLEDFCIALTTGRMSAESYIDYINEAHGNSLNYDRVMPAFHCYLGYKVREKITRPGVFSCYQCGFYPKVVIGDVIPSINFATAHKTVEKGPMTGDQSHLLREMITPDVAKSIQENIVFPIYEHLPGFGTSQNTSTSKLQRGFNKKMTMLNVTMYQQTSLLIF